MTKKQNLPALGTLVKRAIPIKQPLIKLSQVQMETLRTTAEVALAIIVAAGAITIAVAAPNLSQAIDKLFSRHKKRKLPAPEKQKKTIQAFYYLKRSGLIKFKPRGKDLIVYMTDLGKIKYKKIQDDIRSIPKPKTWNGKWWLAAADIPTKQYRQGADLLRNKLKELKFYPLQRTLWIYPHDPKVELQFLINRYGISQFVTLMEISRLDQDDEQKIREFFKARNIL